MPIPQDIKLPDTQPKMSYTTLNSWKRGVISLLDKSKLPRDSLEEATNIFLVEDGQPSPRPGVGWFGTSPTYYGTGTASQSGTTITGAGTTFTSAMVGMTVVFSTGETGIIITFTDTTHVELSVSQTVSSTTYVINPKIDGFDYFVTSASAIHVVMAAGGNIYFSTDDGATWTVCTGGTYTAGTKTYFNQNRTYLYITNGVDNILRYDGDASLNAYTVLTTPSAPTKDEGSGLTGTGFQWYYKCTAVNSIGFTVGSSASTKVEADIARASWVSGTDFVTLTLDALQSGAGQTRYDIYISENNDDYFYLGSTGDTTFVDDGTLIPVPSTVIPTTNTTQGPLVEELTNIGSRQYGIRDTTNSSRIWFSGAGAFSGAFSSAYDGGYLDWQEGGKIIPKVVKDYRDGKGTPLATIWCDSGDGQGAIIQMSLDTLTIADISITVPSAYQLPGSRGTPAPGSVINVLNDYHFYNSQAFYNLGSRQNLQQILSTDEISANIRPSMKAINNAKESSITSIYYDAKIYHSYPKGDSTTNNYTAIFDTERKAWLPTAFNIGFDKFLRYTTTTGVPKLLTYKNGDTKLSEISTGIEGDYGAAFTTTLRTGLQSTNPKNRFEFNWVEEGELEFSNPIGSISIKLIGIERSQGFSTISTPTISASLTGTGWDSKAWDTTAWDDTSDAVAKFSESSVKRYFNVNKELNATQWEITTSAINSYYILRTLQTHGTDTLSGKPRDWKI